jgi:phosphoribosylformylglycinamidine cyclo-ligase
VGLESSGQATYEKEYNGGMGSNGLSSARHDVFSKIFASKYPETFDSSIPSDLVYTGKYKVTDKFEDVSLNAGKLVLSPTRTYAPIVKAIFKEHRKNIAGMIHCSGGGQTKVLHFINDLHIIKDNLFNVPPLFRMIREESNTSWQEMYKVFNMGHRMEFYVEEKYADDIINISKSFKVDAKIIGRVESGKGKKLTIRNKQEIFTY